MKLIIISGQSGSGKTIALHMLEDLGYRTIDNLPVELYQEFIAGELQHDRDDSELEGHIAIGVDPRATQTNIASLIDAIEQTRSQVEDTTLLHLSTHADTLQKRYSETRRRHPFANANCTVEEAIEKEASQLAPLAQQADIKIDTTGWSSHELRNVLREHFAPCVDADSAEPTITVQSFGFKYGNPRSADYVFDVRCLPNPYWEPALRDLTGRDPEIQQWLGEQAVVNAMLNSIDQFFQQWLSTVLHADRSYVTIAIGCTGGRHRSVFIAEHLQQRLAETWPKVLLRHRELDK